MTYTPLKMIPCYKETLWGGTRLKSEYNKTDAPIHTAESWELACHPSGNSIVADGSLKGMSLKELAAIDKNGFWGQRCNESDFPVLVKMIDADKDLSIQVHPSDKNARFELGERGKAEMWYVVDCKPGTYLYYGFSKRISKEAFIAMAQSGKICDVLNKVYIHPGDVFYILPGIIHAVGAGSLIAEIQQNSDTTFRIYDFERKDAKGNLRKLHLNEAADVLDYTPLIPERSRSCNSFQTDDYIFSEMFSCRYFSAFNISVKSKIPLVCDGMSFHHILGVKGCGTITANNYEYLIKPGDSYFIPAKTGEYEIHGECNLLLSKR